jgi:hypothetical protein
MVSALFATVSRESLLLVDVTVLLVGSVFYHSSAEINL